MGQGGSTEIGKRTWNQEGTICQHCCFAEAQLAS